MSIPTFFLIATHFLLVSCSFKEEPLGSAKNPVKIYFTPSVDSEAISSNSRDFIDFIQKETGLYFKTAIPANYITVVEAFGSNRADISVMNSFGYLKAHEKYGVRALLKVIRYGNDFYQGEIITHVDNNINDIKELNNKKFAFTDSASTSGYIFPLAMLRKSQVELKNTVFAIKHDNVVTMVYQKQVDAGAAFYSPPDNSGNIRDARIRVRVQFPDVEQKIKILALTEKIPNDPFVFRKDLPDEIVNKFIAALKKYLSTDQGKKSFDNIYSFEGVVDATDKDYDGLRAMINLANIDTESLIQ